jgi:hypothetical protein
MFDRLARCNQTGIDRGATVEILDRFLALRDNTVDHFAGLGLGPLAQQPWLSWEESSFCA